MKAVVMAGGVGLRLRPLTIGRPKPMVPFFNKPVLAHVLELLKRHHFSDIVINVQYLAHQIQEYFGDGRRLGLTIHYAVEETPLGTAGSVKNAQQYLGDESFLVISGDIITDIDLAGVLRFHHQKQGLATLVLKQVDDLQEYGMVVVNSEGRVRQYVEKPDHRQVISDTANTGIYVLEPEVLDYMEPGVPYDFSGDIFPQMLRQNESLFGYLADGYWRDVGTIQNYQQATADVLAGKVKHIDLGHYIGGGVWTGRNVEIAPEATLYGPIYLGDEVKINRGATIYGPTVVCAHTTIGSGAWIEQSVIGQDCFVSGSVEVQKSVILQPHNPSTESFASEDRVSADL